MTEDQNFCAEARVDVNILALFYSWGSLRARVWIPLLESKPVVGGNLYDYESTFSGTVILNLFRRGCTSWLFTTAGKEISDVREEWKHRANFDHANKKWKLVALRRVCAVSIGAGSGSVGWCWWSLFF